MRRTYKVGDVLFASLRLLADAAGISYSAAVKRCHRGFSDDEIFHGKKKAEKIENEVDTRCIPLVLKGIEYSSISEAYRKINPDISFNAMKARIFRGWSAEQALGLEKRIDGRKNRADQKSNHARQDKMAIVSEAGMRVDLIGNALNSEKLKKEITKFTVEGVEYTSVAKLAAAYGLPYALVYNRMKINKWSPEKAINEPITKHVVIDGVTYRSAMQAWQSIGKTNFSTYQARKKAGNSLEVCLGLSPLPSQSLSEYEVNGKVYHSLHDVALDYEISVHALRNRLKTMTLEKAVRHIPTNGRYTEKRFMEDPELAKSIGILYFVRVVSSSGILHKIGITLKPVRNRLASISYNAVAEFKGELAVLFKVEQIIIKKFHSNLYRADDDFDGRTETFLLMDNEEKEILEAIRISLAG